MVDTVQMANEPTGPVAPAAEPTAFVMPEKFAGKSPEEIAQAYSELEKKLGAPKEEPKTPVDDKSQVDEPAVDKAAVVTPDAYTSIENAEKAVIAVGLDYGKYEAEYAEKGSLTDESYKELESKGFSRDGIDALIEREAALTEKKTNALLEHVGGKEGFAKLSAWAEKNLPAAEVEEINDILAEGNTAASRLALETIKFRMESKSGFEPTLNLGGNNGASGPAYQSWAQVSADMAKPEYKSDPAFRAQVTQRIANSKLK